MFAEKVVAACLFPTNRTLDSSDSRIGRGMRGVILQVKALWRGEEGKDMVEYGLLLVLLSLAGITALLSLARAFGLFGPGSANSQSTS